MFQFLGHFHLDLISRINLLGAYSILFEVGIPNFVYGSVTLTYDLVSRIIVSGAYLLYYLR